MINNNPFVLFRVASKKIGSEFRNKIGHGDSKRLFLSHCIYFHIVFYLDSPEAGATMLSLMRSYENFAGYPTR